MTTLTSRTCTNACRSVPSGGPVPVRRVLRKKYRYAERLNAGSAASKASGAQECLPAAPSLLPLHIDLCAHPCAISLGRGDPGDPFAIEREFELQRAEFPYHVKRQLFPVEFAVADWILVCLVRSHCPGHGLPGELEVHVGGAG